MHAGTYAHIHAGVCRGQERTWNPLDWNYRQLWAPRTLNHPAISPAPIHAILQREFLLRTTAWYIFFESILWMKRLEINYEDRKPPFKPLWIPAVTSVLLISYHDFRHVPVHMLSVYRPSTNSERSIVPSSSTWLLSLFVWFGSEVLTYSGLDLDSGSSGHQLPHPTSFDLLLSLSYQYLFSINYYKC